MKTKQQTAIFGLTLGRQPPLTQSLERIRAIKEKGEALQADYPEVIAFDERYNDIKQQKAKRQVDYRSRCQAYHRATTSSTAQPPDPGEPRRIRLLGDEIAELDSQVAAMREQRPEVTRAYREAYSALVIAEIEPWRVGMHQRIAEFSDGIEAMKGLCAKLAELDVAMPWLMRESHKLLPILQHVKVILETDMLI